jgi:hypothetical protein
MPSFLQFFITRKTAFGETLMRYNVNLKKSGLIGQSRKRKNNFVKVYKRGKTKIYQKNSIFTNF